MTRPQSRAAAKTVERLDLEQAFLVTLADLRNLMDDLDGRAGPKLIAKRLRDHGWLLPTALPGVSEFAPGAQAGPNPRGHPFREVIAAHRAHPELDLAVGLTSALSAYALTDRSPDRPEVAVPPCARVPTGRTRACRIVRCEADLQPVTLRDVPVHALATILVHLATRPTDVRSWGGVLDVLPDLVAAVAQGAPVAAVAQAAPNGGHDALERELHDRPAAVPTRSCPCHPATSRPTKGSSDVVHANTHAGLPRPPRASRRFLTDLDVAVRSLADDPSTVLDLIAEACDGLALGGTRFGIEERRGRLHLRRRRARRRGQAVARPHRSRRLRARLRAWLRARRR